MSAGGIIEETEQIWRKILGSKPRKFTDGVQKRLEVKMAKAERFCSQFTTYKPRFRG